MPKQRPRLLFVLQAYYNRAGTEQHTKDLASGLADRYEIAFVFPHEGQVHLLSQDTGATALYAGDTVPWPATPALSKNMDESFRTILSSFRPDIIHVQHWFNWPLGILQRVAESKAKKVISFHEYYLITPFFTMEGASDPRETFTREYSVSHFGGDITPYLEQRRAFHQKAIEQFDVRIVPSEYLARTLTKVFPLPYRVIGHGVRPFASKPSRFAGANFRFGYFGSLLPQKGWQFLLQAFPAIRREFKDAELHFFGGGQKYSGPAIDGVYFHGKYEQEDIPSVCSQFHVGLIPSVFAETFSLVLSELWLAGLPAAVSDIGALGERVQHRVNGIKFTPGDVASITEGLRYFLKEKDWRNWTFPRVRLLGEMADEYNGLYLSLLEKGRS